MNRNPCGVSVGILSSDNLTGLMKLLSFFFSKYMMICQLDSVLLCFRVGDDFKPNQSTQGFR